MKVQQAKISEITPYENNARFNDDAVEYVANSINEFGFQQPIVVDKDNVIIVGHTRYKAAKKLGLKEVPIVVADKLNEDQVKAYRLADNKTGEMADWDNDKLMIELQNIDIDMTDFGFVDELNEDVVNLAEKIKENPMPGSLFDSFLIPPFSVLDTAKKVWLDRRSMWLNLGIKSEIGRQDSLVYSKNLNIGNLNGTSIFNPVLTELTYRWFMPDEDKGTNIYDPFAGGSVRGVVASVLGKKYTGIELRAEQVKANQENAKEIGIKNKITWINDDSLNVDKYVQDNTQDLIIACPPYLDLEVYSDKEEDLSTMDTDEFFKVYKDILKRAMKKLKNNRFAVIIVSDVRGKDGMYRDLTGETKKVMRECGAGFYNDIILINAVGTSALRARRIMSSRKVTRRHQNVLVFYKGDQKQIKDDFSLLKELDKALENYSEEV